MKYRVQAGAFLNKIIGSYGSSFSYQVQANQRPDTYQVTAGALPGGLTLNGSTGADHPSAGRFSMPQ